MLYYLLTQLSLDYYFLFLNQYYRSDYESALKWIVILLLFLFGLIK